MEEQKNVNQEPLPEDENVDSSTTEQQTEEAQALTAEQGETQTEEETTEVQEEEQAVPYSRFKEINEERKYYRDLALQKPQPQEVKPQPQDPYAGMDAETSQFYRNLDARNRHIFKEELDKREKVYKEQIGAIQKQTTAQMVESFRRKHPDIKSQSSEETAIAQKISQYGMAPDDAYWAVMGPRGIKEADHRAVKKVKQNIEQKRQANVENSSSVSGDIKSKPAPTFEETFNKAFDAAQ